MTLKLVQGLALLVALLTACGPPGQDGTPTVQATPFVADTATATSIPTFIPQPTLPPPTATVTCTPLPSPTASPTAEATATPPPLPIATSTRRVMISPTPALTQTSAPAPNAQADAQPCQVGQIKGNRNSMIYHVPSGEWYARTHKNVTCFDTEEEAQAAGFRKSKR
jgi:hypothetical protein